MQRKDALGLFVVLVGVGYAVFREGQELGGVSPDPVRGTYLIYVGLAVMAVGSVLWLWLATRPLWLREPLIPWGTRRGDHFPVQDRWRKDLDGMGFELFLHRRALPRGIEITTNAGLIKDGEWETAMANGVHHIEEVRAERPRPGVLRLFRQGEERQNVVAVRLQVFSSRPLEITRIRFLNRAGGRAHRLQTLAQIGDSPGFAKRSPFGPLPDKQ